jgi:hypothetical protein
VTLAHWPLFRRVVAEDGEADEADADEVEDDAAKPLRILAVGRGAGSDGTAATGEADQDGGDSEGERDVAEEVHVHGVSPWVEDCCAQDCTAAKVIWAICFWASH